MTGKGPKGERETVILLNEADDSASIWTASASIYRRMLKLGYQPSEDGERHATFMVPRGDIRLPRPKRRLSEEQRQAVKRRFLGQKGRINRGPERPNGADRGLGQG